MVCSDRFVAGLGSACPDLHVVFTGRGELYHYESILVWSTRIAQRLDYFVMFHENNMILAHVLLNTFSIFTLPSDFSQVSGDGANDTYR